MTLFTPRVRLEILGVARTVGGQPFDTIAAYPGRSDVRWLPADGTAAPEPATCTGAAEPKESGHVRRRRLRDRSPGPLGRSARDLRPRDRGRGNRSGRAGPRPPDRHGLVADLDRRAAARPVHRADYQLQLRVATGSPATTGRVPGGGVVACARAQTMQLLRVIECRGASSSSP